MTMRELRLSEFDQDLDPGVVAHAIEELLSTHELLTLATADQESSVWINVAFYAVAAGNLVFLSERQARHCRNVAANQKVSVSIASTDQSWGPGGLLGMQITGRCSAVESRTADIAFEAYSARYPGTLRWYKTADDLASPESESALYVITPGTFKILDENRFGEERYVAATAK